MFESAHFIGNAYFFNLENDIFYKKQNTWLMSYGSALEIEFSFFSFSLNSIFKILVSFEIKWYFLPTLEGADFIIYFGDPVHIYLNQENYLFWV